MPEPGRTILVTGAHRTGTTWVGKMLAANGRSVYISEPLNVLHRPGVFGAQISKWYTYISEENEIEYLPAFRKLLALRYQIMAEIRSLRTGRDLLRMLRDLSIFVRGKLYQQSVLLKDPFAVFSTVWFGNRLNCRVVITIRHPGGFANSLKRLNWSFDFDDLLDQPTLMRDWLEPYRKKMESVNKNDILDQAGLLWEMIYHVVHEISRLNPDIQVIRHEDLALEPLRAFQDLYLKLGLEFSDGAKHTILNSSSSDNPRELSSDKVHSVILNSRGSMDNWKKRLNREELARLRDQTESVYHIYYSDSDW